MKKVLSILLVALALSALGISAGACGSAEAADSVPGSVYIIGQNTGIAVTGVGKIKVTADIAILNLSVQSHGLTAAEAQQNAAQVMTEVIETLKANGVAEKDIVTSGYSVYPIYDYNRSYPETWVDWAVPIVGYTASNSITIKVRNVDNAGTVVDAAISAGGGDIVFNNIYFTLDNPAQYDAAARELAMADALARAQQLADQGGVKLGKPSYITEYGGFGYYQPPIAYDTNRVEGAVVAGAPNVTTPISPNEIELTLSVQVVYNIQ